MEQAKYEMLLRGRINRSAAFIYAVSTVQLAVEYTGLFICEKEKRINTIPPFWRTLLFDYYIVCSFLPLTFV